MAVSIIDTILLRDAVVSDFLTKGNTLTIAEFDDNIEVIGKFLQEMQAAISVDGYNAAIPYSAGSMVLSGGELWTYVSATAYQVVTPGTDPTVWELTSIGVLLRQPTDNKVVLSLNGTAGNGAAGYVHLARPTGGKVVDRIVVIGDNLTPSGDTIRLSTVVYDGTPANDVDLTGELTTAEQNSQVKSTADCPYHVFASGETLQLKVQAGDVTGDLIIYIKYLE